MNAALLALYHSRLTGGVVVSVGHEVATVTPVWKGEVLTEYTYVLKSGDEKVQGGASSKEGGDESVKKGVFSRLVQGISRLGKSSEKKATPPIEDEEIVKGIVHIRKQIRYIAKERENMEAEWEKEILDVNWGEIVNDVIIRAANGDESKQEVLRQHILLSGGE